MYVTRPLSLYRRDPSALSLPPPEGPNSGVLVIQDVDAQPTCCFGICKRNQITDMPFPQNKNLNVWYNVFVAQSTSPVDHPVVFIPVINQPLSSNRYYVIQYRRQCKGKEDIKSMEENNKTKCVHCGSITDKKPDPYDLNGSRCHQFVICKNGGRLFGIKSSTAGAFTPSFTSRGSWYIETSSKHKFLLHEAPGLDAELRARLPDFNFPLLVTSSAHLVVGKWYSPFIFIQEESLEDQVNNSRYYEITLDQRWEKIFGCENTNTAGNSVTVDVAVDAKVAAVAGNEVSTRRNIVDGFMWFKSTSNGGEEISVGISLAVVERMKWEQRRFGWIGGSGREKGVKVKRVEEFSGNDEWRKFGLYVLVERFLIKRTDGSLVLSYEFKHTNQIRTKWE